MFLLNAFAAQASFSVRAFRFLLLLLVFPIFVPAQNKSQSGQINPVYVQRAEKIVSGLEISRKKKNGQLTQLVASQYQALNKIHDDYKVEAVRLKSEAAADAQLKAAESQKKANLAGLHRQFIKKLKKKLDADQVDKVKDGMTYNVLNVTYTAYLDMILTLTDQQKKTIYNWLKEARELAMDEGTSDDKHKVFGKYKGRINNYLSSEGYNMKAEEKAWQQRLKEKREKEAAGNKGQVS